MRPLWTISFLINLVLADSRRKRQLRHSMPGERKRQAIVFQPAVEDAPCEG